MEQSLSSNFLIELIKCCVISAATVDVVRQHLDYSFIQDEEHKLIFKYIFDYHGANGKSPTVGTISQHLPQTQELSSILNQVRDCNVHDKQREVLSSFETFIRKSRFVKLHQDVKDIYNRGDHEKAMVLLEQESTAINSFTLLSDLHTRVFRDFDHRQAVRSTRDFHTVKIPTGIPPFDHHTHGGVELGTSLLVVARKGVGKSTALRSFGYNAAFRGFTGVHFQGEGMKAQVEDAYDAMWTGVDLQSIKRGDLTSKDLAQVERARQAFMAQCGEIIVVAYEQFDTASIADCRQQLIELKKHYDIKWAVFDYLEKFNPGDGRRYSTADDGTRNRKLAVAEKIVNIGTEFKIATYSATQANDIEYKDWNNPNFVITRSNIANLRATIDPFAYCITLNQTADENDNDVIRVHEESLREYKVKSWEATYHIAQKRELGRFIDVARTNELFWDPIKKVVVRNSLKQ